MQIQPVLFYANFSLCYGIVFELQLLSNLKRLYDHLDVSSTGSTLQRVLGGPPIAPTQDL